MAMNQKASGAQASGAQASGAPASEERFNGREQGCYIVILDRKEELVPIYTKLAMRRYEVGMRIDLSGSINESVSQTIDSRRRVGLPELF